MHGLDSSRLRAQVISDFESLARDIIDAEQMNCFVDAVMATAVGTVREMLNDFNKAHAAVRIPSDVLAGCFAYQPLSSCICVSQVCRSWRTAALSEPTLWFHISQHSTPKMPEVLHMALSRAGALLVELDITSRARTPPEAIYAAIAPFSRQVRHLAWHSEQPMTPWEFPAPNMECFWSSTTMPITDSFLGGQTGRLRSLYLNCVYLPTLCPVLSTVSELSLALTAFDNDTPPSTLTNLFDLFPRIEFLNIRGIRGRALNMLPVGRAPLSLTELWLWSHILKYDLTPHYVAWDSGNLRNVSLTQASGTHANLEPLARGSTRLAVNYGTDKAHTLLMFECPPAIRHTVHLSHSGTSHIATLLSAAQSALNNVQCAMISHIALKPLERVLEGMQALDHLVAHIVPKTFEAGTYPNEHPHAFDWTPLSFLSDLIRTMRGLRTITLRGLRTITLQVWCGDCHTPSLPNADDARSLISQLRALPSGLPPIEVQGFPAAEVSSIDLTGLDVRFDLASEIGALIVHKRWEGQDPFRND